MSDTAPEGQAGWINSDGSFGDMSTAPDSVKDLVSKKGYKGIDGIIESYSNAEKKFGVDPDRLLTLPKDDNDVEGWEKFHTRRGRPKTSDEYKLETQKIEGVELDDATLKKYRERIHKLNLTDKEATGVLDFYQEIAKEGLELQAQSEKEAQENAVIEANKERRAIIDAMKKERGIKTDEEFNALVAKSQKVSEDLGVWETLEKYKLSDNPEIINAFIGLSERVSESVLPANTPKVQASKEQRINEIVNDSAFTDSMNPNHEKIMKEYHELFN